MCIKIKFFSSPVYQNKYFVCIKDMIDTSSDASGNMTNAIEDASNNDYSDFVETDIRSADKLASDVSHPNV